MSSEPEALGQMIKRVQHENHRALDAGLARLGVTLVQWHGLHEIERNPGASLHQLAELTFNSDQAFGMLAARLCAAGWVDRGKGVGRATTHLLTRKGQALLREGQEARLATLAQSFAGLSTEDREQLARLLERVLEAQRARGRPRPPLASGG
jgi:DNA-binding MarR family transcriptional regulator